MSKVGSAILAGADRLGEQAVHLPDVERIAAREVGRDADEALGHVQIAQRVAAARALHAQRLAALRRDVAGGDQRALAPVDLHPEPAAGPGHRPDVDRRHRAAASTVPLTSTLSGEVTSTICFGVGLVPLRRLGRDHAGDPREVASHEAQRVDDVAVGDGQRVGAEAGVALPGAAGGPLQAPSRMELTWQASTSPT